MSALGRQDGFSLLDMVAVMAVVGTLAAMALPLTLGSVRAHRLGSDAAALKHAVGLAKMRASAQFSRARVRVDIPANTFRVQVWDKAAGVWADDGGPNVMNAGVTFGTGGLAAPPPNTQAVIGMSPACTPGLTAADPIAGTACVIFNSRGLPVDSDGDLFGGHALYLTSDTGVAGVTVTTTPLVRAWTSRPQVAAWVEQ